MSQARANEFYRRAIAYYQCSKAHLQSIEGNSSNLLHLKASLSKVIQLNSVDDLKHFAEATALAEKENGT